MDRWRAAAMPLPAALSSTIFQKTYARFIATKRPATDGVRRGPVKPKGTFDQKLLLSRPTQL